MIKNVLAVSRIVKVYSDPIIVDGGGFNGSVFFQSRRLGV
jgi:hypothetical protein